MSRDRYAPPPPSERSSGPERRSGVGIFRLAGWGWGFTIALVLVVGALALFGWVRDDPGRNPAPAAYRAATCEAFAELSAGTRALERGVADSGDEAARSRAATEVERHVAAADDALTDLPAWEPGRSLDQLLGSQIITLTNGAAALAEGSADADLQTALGVDEIGREQLAGDRYGFACSG